MRGCNASALRDTVCEFGGGFASSRGSCVLALQPLIIMATVISNHVPSSFLRACPNAPTYFVTLVIH